VEQITTMGVLPKNVQAETTTNYVFKAHVAKSGDVTTVRCRVRQRCGNLSVAEVREMKKGYFASEEDEAIRARLEAEFGDGAALPK
jgi:hypothetical protein